MQIRMRRQTRYEGRALRPGEVLDVDAGTGQRWCKNGIATAVRPSTGYVVEYTPATSGTSGTAKGNGDGRSVNYRDMKYPALRKLAKAREIKAANITKDNLVALLERSDRVRAAGTPDTQEQAAGDETGQDNGAETGEETQNPPESGETEGEAAGDPSGEKNAGNGAENAAAGDTGGKAGQKKTSGSASRGNGDGGR